MNSVSPVKTSVPPTSSESIPQGWPGVCSAFALQAADLETLIGQQVAGDAHHGLASRVDQRLRVGPALLQLAEVGDVVAVVVGEQDVGDVEVVLVGLGDAGIDRAAGVDEEGGPAGSAATRYVFDSQPSDMERSRSTWMGHSSPMPRGRWVLTSLVPFG